MITMPEQSYGFDTNQANARRQKCGSWIVKKVVANENVDRGCHGADDTKKTEARSGERHHKYECMY